MDTVDIDIFDLPDLVVDGFVSVPAAMTDGAVGATNCDSVYKISLLRYLHIFKYVLSQNNIHG